MRPETLLGALIAKHRNSGILLDANLLLLDVIGRHDVALIGRHKRTGSFSRDDFLLLEEILTRFATVLTTPHILAEVSNLAAQVYQAAVPALRAALAGRIQVLEERHCTGKRAAADRHFAQLGLTDAGVLTLCSEPFFVLTTDATLAAVLQSRGHDALNFRSLSSLNWR